MKQRILDTNFGHLINLKLKRFSEKGIENILLALLWNYLFLNWAKLTAALVKLLLTNNFIFVKTQSLKDPYLVIFVREVDFAHNFYWTSLKQYEYEIKLKNYPQSLVNLHM